jgi:hypothetical protein
MQRISTYVTSAALALMLVGAGCADAAKVATESADLAVNSVQLSAETLEKAKQTAEQANAVTNELNESYSDDITVAWVLTEGSSTKHPAQISATTFGCEDRIALVKEHRMAATNSPVNDALVTLFSLGDQSHEGLYNSLSSSQLKVDKILSLDGVTTDIHIVGTVSIGGACDAPRFREQIEATVRRFKPKFRIFLNGTEQEYRCLGNESGTCQ